MEGNCASPLQSMDCLTKVQQEILRQQATVQVQQMGLQGLGGGLLGAAASTGMSFIGDSDSLTIASDGQPYNHIPSLPPAYEQEYRHHVYGASFNANHIFSFCRINKKVEISRNRIEKEDYDEPLDELRIKVAKWLYN